MPATAATSTTGSPTASLEAFRHSPLRSVISSDRPPFETMAALVCQGLFDRFPNVRVASIEAGAEWVPALVKKLAKAYGQMPSAFASDPVETFRRHVWVAPFYEDDLAVLKDVLGVDRLLFGSDWPHAEGLAEPTALRLGPAPPPLRRGRDPHHHGATTDAPSPCALRGPADAADPVARPPAPAGPWWDGPVGGTVPS